MADQQTMPAKPIEHVAFYSLVLYMGEVWQVWDTEHTGDIITMRRQPKNGEPLHKARTYRRFPWGTLVQPIVEPKIKLKK